MEEELLRTKAQYVDVKTTVARVVFYNPSNKWGVLSVKNTLENDPVFTANTLTLVGNFEQVTTGCGVVFSGNRVSNDTYGFQIAISKFALDKTVSSYEGIVNFLSKSGIKGIDVINARKIYDTFGKESINVVLHEPHKLLSIKGISHGTLEKVMSSTAEYLEMEALIEYGISMNLSYPAIYHLHEVFGDKTLEVLREDVYSIIELSSDFSFTLVDEIGIKSGIAKDDPKRLRAALIHCIKHQVLMSSSTGCNITALKEDFAKTTGISASTKYTATSNQLLKEDLIIVSGSYVFWKEYYDKEEYSSKMFTYLNNLPLKNIIEDSVVEEAMTNFKFTLNDQQKEAVWGLVKNRVCVLTGGPGTGKSTITKAVVKIFKRSGVPFQLLSPTGKATRRITECTNEAASTIHKYLRAKPNSLEDAELPVVPPNSAIIVDESSMMDIMMLAKILELAKTSPIRLILIGDADQLPSVQAGNVISDIIDSGKIPVFRLTDIMRQSKDSNIIKFCADINNGVNIKQCAEKDFEYCEYYDENDLLDDLIHNYKKEMYTYGLLDVQVLAPYKKGVLGVYNLNKFLSNSCRDYEPTNMGYALGDKVMQLHNNYSSEVFNGDCGLVSFSSDDSVHVTYNNSSTIQPQQRTPINIEDVLSDVPWETPMLTVVDNASTLVDKTVTYSSKNISDITLAYANTCHKAQGSEYSVVFVILDGGLGNFLLTRRLLYTAVSRGKKKVYIYSTPGCVSRCIKNTYETPRVTKLKDMIISEYSPEISTSEFDDIDLFDDIDEIPF